MKQYVFGLIMICSLVVQAPPKWLSDPRARENRDRLLGKIVARAMNNGGKDGAETLKRIDESRRAIDQGALEREQRFFAFTQKEKVSKRQASIPNEVRMASSDPENVRAIKPLMTANGGYMTMKEIKAAILESSVDN